MEQEWIKFLETVHANGATERTSTSIKLIDKKSFEPSIPLDKLFELYGNLILAGFEKDEALHITTVILLYGRND